MIIKSKDIIKVYESIKADALHYTTKKRYAKALKALRAACDIGYRSNHLFKDDHIEDSIATISRGLVEKDLRKVDGDKIMMIDSFVWPNRGLTQQYLRAIIASGKKFMFVSDIEREGAEVIYEEVENCGRGKVVNISKEKDPVDKVKTLYGIIYDYMPKAIFTHIHPGSVEIIAAMYAFPHIMKYNVNLTDHAFWAGEKCIDKNIEFRNYGLSLSLQERGLVEEKEIVNPFYPIVDSSEFGGFPIDVEEKIVLLCGGAYYKMIDESNIMLGQLKDMVAIDERVVVMVVGDGTTVERERMRNYIDKHGLQDKIYLLGNRKDIDRVFENSDIYVGSYPIPGGLMSQYAAIKEKPIVSYVDEKNQRDIDELLYGQDIEGVSFTYTDREELMREIEKLIRDTEYREKRGKLYRQHMTTPDDFNERFIQILKGQYKSDIKPYSVDVSDSHVQSVKSINVGGDIFAINVFKYYKCRLSYKHPRLLKKFLPSILKIILKRIRS